MKDKSPCMNCTQREIGCHGRCELYIAFSEEQKKRNEDIRKKKSVHNAITEMHKEQKARYYRNHRGVN